MEKVLLKTSTANSSKYEHTSSSPSLEPSENSQILTNSFLLKTKISNGKKIFEVYHKKELVPLKGKFKSSKKFLIKCIYCNKIYNSINRFQSHMTMHVSI